MILVQAGYVNYFQQLTHCNKIKLSHTDRCKQNWWYCGRCLSAIYDMTSVCYKMIFSGWVSTCTYFVQTKELQSPTLLEQHQLYKPVLFSSLCSVRNLELHKKLIQRHPIQCYLGYNAGFSWIPNYFQKMSVGLGTLKFTYFRPHRND